MDYTCLLYTSDAADELDGVGSTTSVVVDGLDNETLYYFRVAGDNYSGLGEYSSVVSATTT